MLMSNRQKKLKMMTGVPSSNNQEMYKIKPSPTPQKTLFKQFQVNKQILLSLEKKKSLHFTTLLTSRIQLNPSTPKGVQPAAFAMLPYRFYSEVNLGQSSHHVVYGECGKYPSLECTVINISLSV